MDVTRDELEFSISQYLDGTLADAERDALDERLATDAEARAILAEYQSLQGVLVAAPAPQLDWSAFAARVSGAVAEADEPVQSYKISQWFQPARLAIAASVLVAGGLAFSVFRTGGNPGTTPGGGVTPLAQRDPISIKAIDPGTTTPDAATAIAVGPTSPSSSPISIAIGPAPSAGDQTPVVLRYADGVVQRPSKALIVSAAPTAQDSLLTPF